MSNKYIILSPKGNIVNLVFHGMQGQFLENR